LVTPGIYSFFVDLPRPMILHIKKLYGTKLLIGVEIGVGECKNALSILKLLNMKMLYLVDPYMPYDDYATLKEQL